MTIHDPHFLRRLFREFCRRTLTDRARLDRYTIAALRGQQALDAIRLEVFDDAGVHLLTLGLHWLRGVTVLYADPPNRALYAINDREATPDTLHERLTRLTCQCCTHHGVIDTRGRIALEDREATA